MKTLRLIAIALTVTAINSGRSYADHGREVSDRNAGNVQLSGDTTPAGESKECCTPCGAEVNATQSEETISRPSPMREWSFKDR